MSDGPIRITLLCQPATAALRAGRFPEADEPLDATAEAALRRIAFRPGRLHRCWTSPAARARATAAALGLAATPEPLLDDAAAGAWAGRTLDDLAAADPAGLAAWLEMPDFAPPGGEAFSAVLARVGRWLALPHDGPGLVAVTHPAVIRAAVVLALGASPKAAPLIDVVPLGITLLSGRPGRWRLAGLNMPVRRRENRPRA